MEDTSNLDNSQWLIYKTSWHMEDQFEEFQYILDDVTVQNVNKKLVDYVQETIEPVGWRAIWRPDKFSKYKNYLLDKEVDFIVWVKAISQEVLEATIQFEEKGNKDHASDEQLKPLFEFKELEVSLQNLYPLVHQEIECIDIGSTAEVLDQIRYFFDHIWRPWDLHAEYCSYSGHTLKERMALQKAVKAGTVPLPVQEELKSLLTQAKEVHNEILKFEDSEDNSEFIDELEIIRLGQLHQKLTSLKTSFDNLSNPTSRMLFAHQQQVERARLLNVTLSDVSKDVFLVADAVPLHLFHSKTNQLPQILKQLPNISDDAVIRTFHSLQAALDSCIMGMTIFVLPSTIGHTIKHLGGLALGGAIYGLSDECVEIEGTFDTGDSILDLTLKTFSFTLNNISLKAAKPYTQAGIVVHCGKFVMDNCRILDCSVGVELLGDSISEIVNCAFSNLSLDGINCRNTSQLRLANCSFEVVDSVIKMEIETKARVFGTITVTDCRESVLILNEKRYKKIPEDHKIVNSFIEGVHYFNISD